MDFGQYGISATLTWETMLLIGQPFSAVIMLHVMHSYVYESCTSGLSYDILMTIYEMDGGNSF